MWSADAVYRWSLSNNPRFAIELFTVAMRQAVCLYIHTVVLTLKYNSTLNRDCLPIGCLTGPLHMHKNRQEHVRVCDRIILNRRRIVELKPCRCLPGGCSQPSRAVLAAGQSFLQLQPGSKICVSLHDAADPCLWPSWHVADIPGDLNWPRMISTTGATGAGSTATLPKCKVITHATGHKTATRTYKMPLICRRQLQQNQVPATVTAVAFLCLQTRRTSMTCHLEGQAPTSFLPQLLGE